MECDIGQTSPSMKSQVAQSLWDGGAPDALGPENLSATYLIHHHLSRLQSEMQTEYKKSAWIRVGWCLLIVLGSVVDYFELLLVRSSKWRRLRTLTLIRKKIKGFPVFSGSRHQLPAF